MKIKRLQFLATIVIILLLGAVGALQAASWTQDSPPPAPPFGSSMLPGSIYDNEEPEGYWDQFSYAPPEDFDQQHYDQMAMWIRQRQERHELMMQALQNENAAMYPDSSLRRHDPVAVPEPSSLVALAAGVGALGMFMKFNRKRKA